jgi:hypothetical protein
MVAGYDTYMQGRAYGVQSAFAPALTKQWKVGDVVGFYLDLDAREFHLFINKEFQAKTPVGAGPFYPAFGTHNHHDIATILHDVELPAAL